MIFPDFHDLALMESNEISFSVYFSCMLTKIITLELDAYEKLRRTKRGGKSFTEVVRRATWSDAPATVAKLRNFYQQGGIGISDKYRDAVEKAASHDPSPTIHGPDSRHQCDHHRRARGQARHHNDD